MSTGGEVQFSALRSVGREASTKSFIRENGFICGTTVIEKQDMLKSGFVIQADRTGAFPYASKESPKTCKPNSSSRTNKMFLKALKFTESGIKLKRKITTLCLKHIMFVFKKKKRKG